MSRTTIKPPVAQPLSPRSHKGKVVPERISFNPPEHLREVGSGFHSVRGIQPNNHAGSSGMGPGRRGAPDRPWPRALTARGGPEFDCGQP